MSLSVNNGVISTPQNCKNVAFGSAMPKLPTFNIVNPELWGQLTAVKGNCNIVGYAAKWANLMETAMKNGQKLEDVAKPLSTEADKEFQLSGATFNAADKILKAVWKHGEELSKIPRNTLGEFIK